MAVVAAGAVVALALFFQPLPLWFRTFELGMLVAGLLAALAWTVHLASGIHGRHLGKMGEVATATTVLTWWRRRRGWTLINGLYFKDHGDVDHVLVGPGGVFVLESKWTSQPCRLEGGNVLGLAGREPVAQARSGARKVELLLRYGRSRIDIVVHPVVVLWGPGAPSLPGGSVVVDGVSVFEGRKSRRWLPLLTANRVDEAAAEEARRELDAQLDRQLELASTQIPSGSLTP